MDSVLSVAKKSSVYVAGFRLEADVSHSGRVRCFVQSIVTGVNGGEPQVRCNPEPMQGEFVPDGKRFMSMGDTRLAQPLQPLYTRLGNDGTLFGADIKSGAPCRSGVELRKDGGTKKVGHPPLLFLIWMTVDDSTSRDSNQPEDTRNEGMDAGAGLADARKRTEGGARPHDRPEEDYFRLGDPTDYPQTQHQSLGQNGLRWHSLPGDTCLTTTSTIGKPKWGLH